MTNPVARSTCRRQTVRLLLALCVVAASFVLPTSASAIIYCVDTTPGLLENNDSIDPTCETPASTVSAGVEAAAADPGEDTVLIGPGSYVLPSPSNRNPDVTYRSADVLHVRGIEEPHLTLGSTSESQIGFWIFAGAGSTVEGLRLTIPANVDSATDYGFVVEGDRNNAREPLGPVLLKEVNVDGPQASKAVAFGLRPGAVLADSSVELPTSPSSPNTAVSVGAGGGAVLDGDSLAADTGVEAVDGATIERSEIHARAGVIGEYGEVSLSDSLIRMADESGAVGVRFGDIPGGDGQVREPSTG